MSASTTYQNADASRFEFDQFGVNNRYNTKRQEDEELRIVKVKALEYSQRFLEIEKQEQELKQQKKDLDRAFKEDGYAVRPIKAGLKEIIRDIKRGTDEREAIEVAKEWLAGDRSIVDFIKDIYVQDDEAKIRWDSQKDQRHNERMDFIKAQHKIRREIDEANGLGHLDFERERIAKLAHLGAEGYEEKLREIDEEIELRNQRREQGLPPLERHSQPAYPDQAQEKFAKDREVREAKEKYQEKLRLQKWEGFELPETRQEYEDMTMEEFRYAKDYIETKFRKNLHEAQPYLDYVRQDSLRRSALRDHLYYECIQDDIIWKAWCDKYDSMVGVGIDELSPEQFKAKYPEPPRGDRHCFINWENDVYEIKSFEEYNKVKMARLNNEIHIDEFGNTVESPRPEGYKGPAKRIIILPETLEKAKQLVHRDWYETIQDPESRWEFDLQELLDQFNVITMEEADSLGWKCHHEPLLGNYPKRLNPVGVWELVDYVKKVEASNTRNIPEENKAKSEMFLLGYPDRQDQGKNLVNWSYLYETSNGKYGYEPKTRPLDNEKVREIYLSALKWQAINQSYQLEELGDYLISRFKELGLSLDKADNLYYHEMDKVFQSGQVIENYEEVVFGPIDKIYNDKFKEDWVSLNESVSQVNTVNQTNFSVLDDADAWLDNLISGELVKDIQ